MKEKVRSILFVTILIGLAIVNILSPIRAFSNKEGRYLQELPQLNYQSIIKGKFTKEFESFTTDQFIHRDNWISLKTMGDLAILKKDNGRVYFGKDGYLFDVDKEIDNKQFERNLDNVNTFLQKVNQYNSNLSTNILLIPTKSTVVKNKLPPYAPFIDEADIVKEIKYSLGANPNLMVLDLMEALGEKSHEYIYYKTDHHWTTKGAYYAYQYYLNKLDKNPLREEEFIISRVAHDFLGTSYRKANLYLETPDEIYEYIPRKNMNYNMTINNQTNISGLYDKSYLDKTDKYSYFLGGDRALIEIDSSIKNGESILVIKDSFANSFIPFLVNHYERVIVIDPRYFNMDILDYIDENQIDEILFLFNIQNFIQEKSFFILGR